MMLGLKGLNKKTQVEHPQPISSYIIYRHVDKKYIMNLCVRRIEFSIKILQLKRVLKVSSQDC